MDEHRWPDAVTAFDKVINAEGRTPRRRRSILEGLLAQQTRQHAARDCHLRSNSTSQFANSTWNKDCDTISIDVQVDAQANGDKDQDKVKVRTDRVRALCVQ